MSVDSLICSGMNARGCADYDSSLQHTHATNPHHARTANGAGSCYMRAGGAGRRGADDRGGFGHRAGDELAVMLAPFPYFGGKRSVAEDVWKRLGAPTQYIEPLIERLLGQAELAAAKEPTP